MKQRLRPVLKAQPFGAWAPRISAGDKITRVSQKAERTSSVTGTDRWVDGALIFVARVQHKDHFPTEKTYQGNLLGEF